MMATNYNAHSHMARFNNGSLMKGANTINNGTQRGSMASVSHPMSVSNTHSASREVINQLIANRGQLTVKGVKEPQRSQQ